LWARDGEHHTPDLGFWKSEIFSTEGVDTISENQPDGQISCSRNQRGASAGPIPGAASPASS
jgi:hypothetical protein